MAYDYSLLDATPYLFVSFEMKKEDSMKPYDAKKSVWVPNKEEGGYDEGLLQSVEGDKATVKVGWEMKTFKEADCVQVNPPKMEKIEDVTYMTYLNDASVLWNLKTRYIAQLIYVSSDGIVLQYFSINTFIETHYNIKIIYFVLKTYSGLFCVVINPYKRYPIYTDTVVRMYIGKRRNEVPPHLFAISDGAYQQMMACKLSIYSESYFDQQAI